MVFYFTLQEENLDEQVAEKNINHPYIAVVSMDFSVNMFLVVEREIVCSINISYPKLLGAFFVLSVMFLNLKL